VSRSRNATLDYPHYANSETLALNLTVRFPFEASNKLNMALSFEATCVVSGPFTADVVINEL